MESNTVLGNLSSLILLLMKFCYSLFPFNSGSIPVPGRFINSLLTFVYGNDKLKKLEYLTEFYHKHGLFSFDKKIYIFDPRLAQTAINKLEKGAEEYLSDSPLKGTFLGSSDKSPQTRRAIASIFRKTSIDGKGDVMIDDIDKMCLRIKEEGLATTNITYWSMRVALDIVGHVLLQLDFHSLDGQLSDLLDHMTTILHRCYALGEISSESAEFENATIQFDKITTRVLEEALNKDDDQIGGKRLVKTLHEACGFTEAKDNMKLFLMAGTETTASTIPVVFYLLTKYPAVQAELRAEAAENIERIRCDPNTPLPKIESMLREVLRLYPIAPFISRQNYQPVSIGNVHIEQHSDVVVFTWGIHRTSYTWNRSKEFIPFRFLDNPKERSNLYIPFGAGSRVCIGQHLAWLELRLAVAILLTTFEFDLSTETSDLHFVVDWAHAVVHPDKDMIFTIKPMK